MKTFLGWLACIALLLCLSKTLHANDISSTNAEGATSRQLSVAEKKRIRFFQDMEKLLRVAKNAGFSEKELKEITIEHDGETINVWQYIQEELERQKRVEEEELKASNKKYYTVKDIVDELDKKQPEQLKKLRNELLLSGKQHE